VHKIKSKFIATPVLKYKVIIERVKFDSTVALMIEVDLKEIGQLEIQKN
jgi:hypothetical protein